MAKHGLSAGLLGQDFLGQDFLGQDFLDGDFVPANFYSGASWPPGVEADDLDFQPGAYSGAAARSTIAYSADRNSTVQTIEINTRDAVEDFYVRVLGPVSLQPYNLEIEIDGNACEGLRGVNGAASTAQAIGLKTLIFTDRNRLGLMGSSDEEITRALSRLSALAARPEVAGAVIDLADHPRVVDANAIADAIPSCTTAKNHVAAEIKAIIDAYRALNSGLQYIVLAGGAGVIPYYQSPDGAGIANENGFYPPVEPGSASEAGLANGLVQSQDYYGASDTLDLGTHYYYIPDLAVGRLVDDAADIASAVDAALATGLVVNPGSALVTGYDFVADAALAAEAEIEAGLGVAAETLIQPEGLPPTDPTAWHADDLRARLLAADPPDLTFLVGHFDAGRLLAADYQTTMAASEVTASTVDLTDAIVVVLGCHGGYSIPFVDEWPGFSPDPDWAKAFLRKGAAGFVAATGYAYGDTEILEYGERLAVDFLRELRTGSGPTSIGQALVRAKRTYQARLAMPVGIHEKTLLVQVLYGLPMMMVDMPGRYYPPSSTSIVSPSDLTPAPEGTAGQTLGLYEVDKGINPSLEEATTTVNLASTGAATTATYLIGEDGVEANPSQPVLPKHLEDVRVPSYVLRSAAFRGGTFSDRPGITPLMSAATTETSQDQGSFASDVFYPPQPWRANFIDALSGGPTRLAALPAQLKSTTPGSEVDITLRQFANMQFRLYYLGINWPDNPIVARAAVGAPPNIAGVLALPEGNGVRFQIRVPLDQTAGIHAAWVLYTSDEQWVPFDLTQNPADRTVGGSEGELAPRREEVHRPGRQRYRPGDPRHQLGRLLRDSSAGVWRAAAGDHLGNALGACRG